MFWRIVLVSFVGGMLINAAVYGPSRQVLAQPATTVEAPKWDLGDRWTWQRGKDEITWTIVGTAGGYAVQQKFGSDTSTVHLALDFSSKDVHFAQVQFPLTPGKEWTNTVEGIGPISKQPTKWNVKRKVEGMESVTVPAGAFDAVRISGHHCNLANGYCGDFMAWYAPKAKQVAKIMWPNSDYWLASQRGASQVLVSYELHNP